MIRTQKGFLHEKKNWEIRITTNNGWKRVL